ncbi:MOSC domain-containing protein [Paenibacillus sepulcri]
MAEKSIAVVEAVLIADAPSSFVTRRIGEIQVELGGIPGDRHFGLLRKADSRQKIYPRGQLIANRRQISIVSVEECRQIARNMGLAEIRPEWLGANLLLKGLDPLTTLPLGARLVFASGAGLICEGENMPCKDPGEVIESEIYPSAAAKKFVPAAKKLRGIVCSVEREGAIRKNDVVTIIRPQS